MVFLLIPVLSLFTLVSASVVSTEYNRRDVTGDARCSTTMCVSALVNGSTVQYTLSSKGSYPTGWMGLGFGSQMRNTPMVIMWGNSDGSVTISQRKAPGEVMPTLDTDPPRLASLSTDLSTTSGNPSFVFTISANNDKTQSLIYAFGNVNPGSSDESATLQRHLDYGFMHLDLTKPLTPASDATTTTSSAAATPSSGNTISRPIIPVDDATDDIPLTPYQRMIIAHAVFCSIGFAVLLPAGALLARYLRTFTPVWYTGHWIAQFAVAGPAIVAGVALGFRAAAQTGAVFMNTHKRTGIALFVLYLLQCILGAVIHYFKPKNAAKRPVQNYVHAVLGLTILAVALYQVRSGYHTEWPGYTGLGNAPGWVNVLWIIWVIALPLLYAAGLSFLPKQRAQEAAQRKGWLEMQGDTYGMLQNNPGQTYHDQ